MEEKSYTIEEIAQILKVSKLTVYDLIKKEKLAAYRVGRQMRVDEADLNAYKSGAKISNRSVELGKGAETLSQSGTGARPVIISGQDVSLDILSKHIENSGSPFRPLRSYAGSLNSLISMYHGECDIVSLHLFDGETQEYNVPYTKRVLTGHSYLVINLLYRSAGLYVQKGNPKQLASWEDIGQPGLRMVNREKGSGARVLLDEQLKLHEIKSKDVQGYEVEESNHLGVAGAVADQRADFGIGIEKAARMVGVDFIPLIKERYDLIIKKTEQNQSLIQLILSVLQSSAYRQEMESIGGYDLSDMGQVIYESDR